MDFYKMPNNSILMKTVNVKSLGQCPYYISLEPDDMIGKGSYAVVNRAYNRDKQDQMLAAKTFELSDSKKFQSAIKELMIVSKIPSHQNLVEYKKIKITSKNRLYIIMELCQESLQRKLNRSQKGLSQNEIWQLIDQFCAGYKVLQQKSIVHQDIKPDNILIGRNGQYKISDFGLSEIIEIKRDRKLAKGSLPFMAPQYILQNEYLFVSKQLADVYSFGVTLFYSCFRQYPYIYQQEKKKRKFSISIHNFLRQIKNNSLKFPSSHNFSQSTLCFIANCLEKSAKKRSSWQYIYLKLLQRNNKTQKNDYNSLQLKQQKFSQKIFKIVQISDTFLKNLSTMDIDLYKSLSTDSVILIDHIEADIISKRQLIYFCDRLYYRLLIISQKLKENPNLKSLQKITTFCHNLLIFNFLKCQQLDTEFQKYYSKVDKSEFLKCLTSQKYIALRSLIRQDLQFLTNTLNQQLPSQQQSHIKICDLSLHSVKIYQLCSQMIFLLYQSGFYEECIHVDEVQKIIEHKCDTILKRFRKNQNALHQFDSSLRNLTKQKLKTIISKHYICNLKKLDKKK